MSELKKPKKKIDLGRLIDRKVNTHNQVCDEWQAYHDQELAKKDAKIKKLENVREYYQSNQLPLLDNIINELTKDRDKETQAKEEALRWYEGVCKEIAELKKQAVLECNCHSNLDDRICLHPRKADSICDKDNCPIITTFCKHGTKPLDAGVVAVLSKALKAICLTRDYVGENTLPPIGGWEWYDAGHMIAELIPDDEWAEQFYLRIQQPR